MLAHQLHPSKRCILAFRGIRATVITLQFCEVSARIAVHFSENELLLPRQAGKAPFANSAFRTATRSGNCSQ